eukprot:4539779-Prymnesium_polylepis.1
MVRGARVRARAPWERRAPWGEGQDGRWCRRRWHAAGAVAAGAPASLSWPCLVVEAVERARHRRGALSLREAVLGRLHHVEQRALTALEHHAKLAGRAEPRAQEADDVRRVARSQHLELALEDGRIAPELHPLDRHLGAVARVDRSEDGAKAADAQHLAEREALGHVGHGRRHHHRGCGLLRRQRPRGNQLTGLQFDRRCSARHQPWRLQRGLRTRHRLRARAAAGSFGARVGRLVGHALARRW